MDFKGITWVGNLYQKFEAMCLEMEEVMCQDTVDYVENQVQKVDVSVKKFYSEVMQDLLPPSFVDPVKVAAGDLSLNPCAHYDVNKKPKASILGNRELKKEGTEDKVTVDMDAEIKSSLTGFDNVNNWLNLSPGVSAQNAYSLLYSAKNEDVGLDVKRISDNSPPSIICGPTATILEDKSHLSLLPDVKESCISPSDHTNFALYLDSVERCNSEAAVNTNTLILDAPGEYPASNPMLSVDCVRQKEEVSQCTSSSHGFPSESIGSSISNDTCGMKSGNEEFIMSEKDIEDYFEIEVIKNDEVEPRVDIVKQVEKSKLDESCVMVERDMLHLVPQGIAKKKSYKKKIREAFLSKSRSTRKQECDKHVLQYGTLDGTKGAVMVTPGFDMVSDDFSESDWELL